MDDFRHPPPSAPSASDLPTTPPPPLPSSASAPSSLATAVDGHAGPDRSFEDEPTGDTAATVWEWVRPLLVLLIVLFSFRSAVADWNDVPSGSMKPTILVGDRVFVNKVAYDLKVPFTTLRLAAWANPERGDIVVLKSPENGRRLIKRVIGLPGDTIALRNNRLYVDGQPAIYERIDPEIADRLDDLERSRRLVAWESVDDEERHPVMVIPSLDGARGNFGPVEIPRDTFFMMGDNRDESRDSRSIGVVPRDLILGRAVGVAFSLDHDQGWRFRPGRWFEALE